MGAKGDKEIEHWLTKDNDPDQDENIGTI